MNASKFPEKALKKYEYIILLFLNFKPTLHQTTFQFKTTQRAEKHDKSICNFSLLTTVNVTQSDKKSWKETFSPRQIPSSEAAQRRSPLSENNWRCLGDICTKQVLKFIQFLLITRFITSQNFELILLLFRKLTVAGKSFLRRAFGGRG